MKLTGNTILITGGGSGIGRGLAEGFQKLGNQVIIGGRRKSVLDEVTAANPGMKSVVFDVEDKAGILALAAKLRADYPALNVLINNAGIMRPEDLLHQPQLLVDAEAIVTTNLLGPIRLTAAMLPQLRQKSYAAIVNVSSGLAFVPLATTPTYSATKAALHSYTQSLRYQLKGSPVEVLELIPPYVQTELMDGAADPRAMPLKEFLAEVFGILQANPTVQEICVERVKGLRLAEKSGKHELIFAGLNDSMSKPVKE